MGERKQKNVHVHLHVGVYDDWEKELEKICNNFAEGITVWSRCMCHEDGKKSQIKLLFNNNHRKKC